MKTCDIIIVNWNSGSQLHSCINSILEFGLPLVNQIIVVDNGSTDGSEIDIENLPKVILIRAGYNRGFAVACNQGAAFASENYLLFLNPDTRLFPNSLSIPLDYMNDKKNAKVGICGIQLVDESGRVSRSCARFPSLSVFLAQALGLNRLARLRHLTQAMAEWSHDTTQSVDQVIGAFFLIRYSLFKSLGGFDERFFVYFEEVDFALRAHQAGWYSVYLANAQAYHAGGGTSRQVKAHRLFYSLRSRLLYGFKHFSLINAWLLMLLTLGLEPFTRIIFALAKGEWHDMQHTLKGYLLLFRALPAILRVALK
jgi:GT2 family glycosyltransferase